MRRLLPLLSLPFLLFAAGATTKAIEKDIKKTADLLTQKKQEASKISSGIDDAARDILEERGNLKGLDAQIGALESDVAQLSKEHAQKIHQIEEYEAQKQKLANEKEEIEKKLVQIIAKDLSTSIVISSMEATTPEDILRAQGSKTLSKIIADQVKKLKEQYLQRQQMVKELEEKVRVIKSSIVILDQKKTKLAQTKDAKLKAIAQLQKKMQSYKSRLERLAKEQMQARDTLERLNILKRKKLVEASRKPTPAARTATAKPTVTTPDVDVGEVDLSNDVKRLGSSYQAARTVHYGGRKVPPPIEDYRVVKQFGPYIDPVYKIKIHNDSVQLRSNSSDAMVKNILDGKVVFAKEVAALGNVVIVQHEGNLHTIYAHLAKIAPTISVGKKIPQGSIVGRIDKELTFEVTKEDVPINPLEVITQ